MFNLTIWKFDLIVADEQLVAMPEGAELLFVDEQNGEIKLWARVNPSNPRVNHKILIRGTGHVIEDDPYIGSAITAGGVLVWHVFDGGVVSDY